MQNNPPGAGSASGRLLPIQKQSLRYAQLDGAAATFL